MKVSTCAPVMLSASVRPCRARSEMKDRDPHRRSLPSVWPCSMPVGCARRTSPAAQIAYAFHRVGPFSPPARSMCSSNGVLKGHSGRFWCNPRSDPRNIGDVAQSEEHLLCKQGVGGSSPLVSTPKVLVDMSTAVELGVG